MNMPFDRRGRARGFTVIELMIVLSILGVIAAIAFPTFQDSQRKARVAQAISDIVEIEQKMEKYFALNYAYPTTLAVLGYSKKDPWGNDYMYLNFATATGKGMYRKDKALNPLNTDYDLYSSGEDGVSKTQVSSKESLDDVIRANDGAFVGLASDY
jgi:general secretion pathway protein G